MPTEIAKASLSESSCFCICAFSTCLSCTYCVSSLFQVLQEVVYEWIMVSLLQQSTYNHAIIYLFSQHSLPVFSVLVPILGKQRWAESSPLGSHCCQVVECRFPAWLSWLHSPVLTHAPPGESRRQLVHQQFQWRGHFCDSAVPVS